MKASKTQKPTKPSKTSSARLRGIGLRQATEAINALKQIPKADCFREQGMRKVLDFILHNHTP
jgi:hypothetical protein